MSRLINLYKITEWIKCLCFVFHGPSWLLGLGLGSGETGSLVKSPEGVQTNFMGDWCLGLGTSCCSFLGSSRRHTQIKHSEWNNWRYQQWFSNFPTSELSWCSTNCCAPRPEFLSKSELSLRICMFYKFPDDAPVTSLESNLEDQGTKGLALPPVIFSPMWTFMAGQLSRDVLHQPQLKHLLP